MESAPRLTALNIVDLTLRQSLRSTPSTTEVLGKMNIAKTDSLENPPINSQTTLRLRGTISGVIQGVIDAQAVPLLIIHGSLNANSPPPSASSLNFINRTFIWRSSAVSKKPDSAVKGLPQESGVQSLPFVGSN